MTEDYKIAIFTPTYNRSKFMSRLFDQLEKQTDKNFVWYIIDDGSSDDTEDVVGRLINTTSINVKYYKKENGGKHSAFNYFIDKVEEKFSVIALDSDDSIVNDAVETVRKDLSLLEENECGIVYINKQTGRKDDIYYDTKRLNGHSLCAAIMGNMFRTECTFVFKTDFLRNYRYPIIEGEIFMTEAYLYIQMNQKMRWSSNNIEYGQPLNDGLENKLFKIYKENPVGWRMFNELRLRKSKKTLQKAKYRLLASAFRILSKDENKNNERGLLDILFIPFGFAVVLYISFKARRVKNGK